MPGGLRRTASGLCELDHISPYFFGARWWPGKTETVPETEPDGKTERTCGFWVGNGDGQRQEYDGSGTPHVAIGKRTARMAVDAD